MTLNVILRFRDLPERMQVDWMTAELLARGDEYRASLVATDFRVDSGHMVRVLAAKKDGDVHVRIQSPPYIQTKPGVHSVAALHTRL